MSKNHTQETPTGSDQLVDVAVLVLPTGEVFWINIEQYTQDYVCKVIQTWKEQHPEFDDSKCSMGMVVIKMPLSRYNSLHTSNSLVWPDT